jgi:hypothetical protein
MIIPQYPGIKLVEFWDHLELVPVGWYRNIVGLGRFKADKVGFQAGEAMFPMFQAAMENKEIWVIVSWRIYEDGTEEVRQWFLSSRRRPHKAIATASHPSPGSK